VTAEKGCMVRAFADQQYSQGGVLSPLLRSLVVKGLHLKLNRGYLCTLGYTDDMAFLFKFSRTVLQVIQRAQNLIQKQFRAKVLSVNLNKMENVLFTKRKMVDRSTIPVLLDRVICLIRLVKNLEVCMCKGWERIDPVLQDLLCFIWR
jgi:hypothetical protein